ncbi:HNH endonuclease [Silvimonas sp.]|uniref:HNH endonuclease n=1 Tax=Silvimonas sp. TaxID=2650811 RepID=UPI00284D6F7A|nr:HNH endonuclease [Silvimonas sp.]MDR3427954.1 HNH endonuclease [Silvimonas sp.]
MPYRAKRPCPHPGCHALVDSGWCAEHQRKRDHSAYDSQRGTASERGYNARWQKARATYLRSHPCCVRCKPRDVPAAVVDHIKPHKMHEALISGDDDLIAFAQSLFWDTSNWQALCKRCHDRKTAKEDGGFGRSRVRETDKGAEAHG